MKKGFNIFLSVFLIFGFASCKGCKDPIFPGVEFKVPDITITIPAIPFVQPGGEFPLPPFTQPFNLDSAVRANTGGSFGADAVSSVKLKSMTITLTNADNLNNLSNFESAKINLASNTQTTQVTFASFTFPPTNTTTATNTPTTDNPELLPYLKGKELTYHVFGKLRKVTTKSLNMTVSAVLTGK